MIEARAVYFCHNADFAACVVDALLKKTILFIEKKRCFFYLNSISISESDRTGQGIMQEVDDVIRKAVTGLAKASLILLVD